MSNAEDSLAAKAFENWDRRDKGLPVKAPPITEAAFMDSVVDLATRRGWAWLHLVKAPYRDQWRTPFKGPLGKGFPDLLMVRGDRLLAVELKRAGGKPSPEQTEVLRVLSGVGESFVWTPLDWPTIEGVLR